MSFIVETGPQHPGIKLYVGAPIPPSRRPSLVNVRDKATRFFSRIAAQTMAGRFSDLYGMLVTEVADV